MKKIIAVLVGAIALGASCTKEYSVDISNDINVTVEGHVFDSDGRVPLSEVTIFIDNKETVTDENGYYKLSGISSGSYTIRVEKSGYFSEIYSTESNDNQNFYGDQYQTADDIYLEKKEVNVTLNIQIPELDFDRDLDMWYQALDPDDNTTPLWEDVHASKTVVVTLQDGDYVNRKYTVSTSSGSLALTELPAASSVHIKIEYLEEDNEVKFSGEYTIETDNLVFPTLRLAFEDVRDMYEVIGK